MQGWAIGLLGRELSTKGHKLTWMGGPNEIIRSYGLCDWCHTPKICKIHTKYSYLTATANGLKSGQVPLSLSHITRAGASRSGWTDPCIHPYSVTG